MPLAVVGRNDLFKSFDSLLARIERARTAQSMIVTGLRGVGKTVLLNKFRHQALERNWVIVEVEARKHDESEFRREIASKLRVALLEVSRNARRSQRLQHAMAVLRSFTISVDRDGVVTAGLREIDPAEGYADHLDLSLDLVDVFLSVGEAAAESHRGVCVLLDEIQFLRKEQLEALITALHKVIQRNLPLTLVGAGLPQIAELAGDAKSYAERLFSFPSIGSLSPQEAMEALSLPAQEEGVTYTPEALEQSVRISGGYPYFVQELGSAVWTVAEGPVITLKDMKAALAVYEAKLDSSFFRVRIDRTTQLQRAYLRAMAELGSEPQKASDVAEKMGRTSQNLAPTRAELINIGLLYTPQHGYSAFTVPHFDKYLMRAIPKLEVPELLKRRARSDRQGRK